MCTFSISIKSIQKRSQYVQEQDSSPTRQFTDTIFEDSSHRFEDSSQTLLKTVHRHFFIM